VNIAIDIPDGRRPPAWICAKEHPFRLAAEGLERLQASEQAAILLAEALKADIIPLDEKVARRIAASRGLRVAGLLGVLGEAASRGLLNWRLRLII
jgi:predicted nucleic acid-binding protein